MVMLKNRFRGVKQNLKRARVYWDMKVWTKFGKRNKLKFYTPQNKKKYNAPKAKKDEQERKERNERG